MRLSRSILADMGVYLRGGWYRYKRQIGGCVYHRALKLKRGQESMLSARLRQVEDEITALHFGLPPPATGHGVYFSDLLEQFLADKKGLPVHPHYKSILERAMKIMGDKPLNLYLKYNWRNLDDALFAQKLMPGTVNKYMTMLHAVFAYAVKKRMMGQNPLADYEYHVADSRARALTDAEVSQMLIKLKGYGVIHDLVLFGLLTGARVSEAIYLRRSYIEGDIAWFPISQVKHRRRSRNPGPPKKKPLLLSPGVLEIIERQPPSIDDPDYVFPLNHRRNFTSCHPFKKIKEIVGIPDFHFHLLRHTFASRIATMTDPGTARVLLGHSDIQTTMRYAHSEILAGRDAVAKLDARFLGYPAIN